MIQNGNLYIQLNVSAELEHRILQFLPWKDPWYERTMNKSTVNKSTHVYIARPYQKSFQGKYSVILRVLKQHPH